MFDLEKLGLENAPKQFKQEQTKFNPSKFDLDFDEWTDKPDNMVRGLEIEPVKRVSTIDPYDIGTPSVTRPIISTQSPEPAQKPSGSRFIGNVQESAKTATEAVQGVKPQDYQESLTKPESKPNIFKGRAQTRDTSSVSPRQSGLQDMYTDKTMERLDEETIERYPNISAFRQGASIINNPKAEKLLQEVAESDTVKKIMPMTEELRASLTTIFNNPIVSKAVDFYPDKGVATTTLAKGAGVMAKFSLLRLGISQKAVEGSALLSKIDNPVVKRFAQEIGEELVETGIIRGANLFAGTKSLGDTVKEVPKDMLQSFVTGMTIGAFQNLVKGFGATDSQVKSAIEHYKNQGVSFAKETDVDVKLKMLREANEEIAKTNVEPVTLSGKILDDSVEVMRRDVPDELFMGVTKTGNVSTRKPLNEAKKLIDRVRDSGASSRINPETVAVLNKYSQGNIPLEKLTDDALKEIIKAEEQLKFAYQNQNVLMSTGDNAEQFVKKTANQIMKDNKFIKPDSKATTGMLQNKAQKLILQASDEHAVATMIDPHNDGFQEFVVQGSRRAVYDGEYNTIIKAKEYLISNGIDLDGDTSKLFKGGTKTSAQLAGKTVGLDKQTKLALYLTVQDEETMKGLVESGVFISGTENAVIKPTLEELKNLSVDADSLAIASKLKNVFEITADSANKTSKVMYGQGIELKQKYFPNRRYTGGKSTGTSGMELGDITEFFRRTDSKEPFLVENVFDSVNRHIKSVGASENQPFISDLKKIVYSDEYKNIFESIFKPTAGAEGISPQKSAGLEYIDKFVERLSGVSNGDSLEAEKLISGLVDKSIKSKILYNLTTIPKQFTSIVSAVRDVKPQNLVKGFLKNVTGSSDDILKNYPEIKYRSYGQTGVREATDLAGKPTGMFSNVLHKTIETGAQGIRKMDMFTVTSIYRGAEEQVLSSTNLKKGTAEFYDAVKRIARDSLETQPNYGKLATAPMLTNKNPLMKIATAYQTYTSRGFSNLVASGTEVINGVDGAKTKFTKTLGGLVGASYFAHKISQVSSDVSSPTDFDETAGSSVVKDIKGTSAMLVGTVPIIGTRVAGLMQGYELEDMTLKDIENFIGAFQDVSELFTREYADELDAMYKDGKIDEQELDKLLRREFLGRLNEAVGSFGSLGLGVSTETVKGSADKLVGIGADLGLIDQSNRVDFQLSDEPPYNRRSLNLRLDRAVKEGNEDLADALLDELSLQSKKMTTSELDPLANIDKYSQTMRDYIRDNRKFIDGNKSYYKDERIRAVDTVAKMSGIEPNKIFEAIEEARGKKTTKRNIVSTIMNNKGMRTGTANGNAVHAKGLIRMLYPNYADLDKLPSTVKGNFSYAEWENSLK